MSIYSQHVRNTELYNLVHTISEECPLLDCSNGRLKIGLKIHQQRLLHCMNLFETEVVTTPDYDFISKVGLIADKVGSGKSICVLALLCFNPVLKLEEKRLTRFGGSRLLQTMRRIRKIVLPTNVIVVPHSLAAQWCQYIREMTDLRCLPIRARASMTDLVLDDSDGIYDVDKLCAHDLIVVSSTMFGEFGNNEIWDNYQIQRLIIDEADTIRIPGSPYINEDTCTNTFEAYFTWYITASFRHMFQPFYTNKKRSFLLHCKYLMLKNDDSVIDASFNLPSPVTITVLCHGVETTILDGVVSGTILTMICAGDTEGAINYLGYPVENENNLVGLVCKKTFQVIHNLEIEIEAMQMMDLPVEEKEELIRKSTGKLEEEKNKLSLIKERLNDSIDPISISTITNPVITLCCQNRFELDSIMDIMKYKKTTQPECPLCRTVLTQDKLLVVDRKNAKSSGTDSPLKQEGLLTVSEEFDKMKNLEILLRYCLHGKKVLIFSEYEKTFDKITNVLASLNIRFSRLCGTSVAIQSTIHQYKTSTTLNVLLLNATYFGAGLNLENTEHVVLYHRLTRDLEKQVIGRCQRPGRTSPLTIHKLVYRSEHL